MLSNTSCESRSLRKFIRKMLNFKLYYNTPCHKFSYQPVLRPWQTRTHCCEHIVADTNVSAFARARHICCGHKFCVRETKMFLILFRNILCPQQMFPSLRSPRNIMGNNVSATMCPRLPGPLGFVLLLGFRPYLAIVNYGFEN